MKKQRVLPDGIGWWHVAMAGFIIGMLAIPASAQLETVGGAYSNQGPGPVTGESNTQTTGSGGNDEICGALETVVAHPSNAAILWAGSVNGGVFRTNDATAANPTWAAQMSAQTSLSISAMEFDPTGSTTSGSETLVAGTGSSSAYGGVRGDLIGLLRTTDGGTTWTTLAAAGLPASSSSVKGIAPRGATIVAAMNFSGIYRSTDTGATFTAISGGGGTGLPAGRTFDLASNPQATNELFTVVSGNGNFNDGVYYSADTGATWAKASVVAIDSLLTNPDNAEMVVGTLGSAGTANVYIGICNSSGALSGLFRSPDSGTTWVQLDTPTTSETVGSFGIHPGGQCGIHLSLGADPTNHNVVYIAGDRQPCADNDTCVVSPFPNAVGADTFSGRVFKVDASLGSGLQATSLTNNGTLNDTGPHADSRDMAFDANNALIQADDGGIFRRTSPLTTDGTAGDWFEINGDLAAVEQHDASYDTSSNTIMSGNQDNGTTYQSAQDSATWPQFRGGDGGDVEIKAGDDITGGTCGTPCSTRYLSSQNLGGARRSAFDSAGAWEGTSAFLNLSGISPYFRTPIKVNADSATHFVIGASNGVWESSDRGNNFTNVRSAANEGMNWFYGTPLAYGADGANNTQILYYGASPGGDNTQDNLYVRTGAVFTIAAEATNYPGQNSGDRIQDIAIDPDDANHAFVVDTNQVFRTTDAGATPGNWSDVTGNLFTGFSPGVVNAVTYVANAAGDGVIVGTNRGVYRARADASYSTWDQLGTGLPNALVYDLDYDATDDVLIVGTMGRGSWKITNVSATVPVELQWMQVE